MKILVINAGSSSLKYQLIDTEDEQVLAKGNCERIGEPEDSFITHKAKGKQAVEESPFATHTEAFRKVLNMLTEGELAVLTDLAEVAAVGHRVVHGGEKFASSVLITKDVLKTIEECSELAPLHNPPAVLAIRACQTILPDTVPQVAVFDTAFHQTMPPKAYQFGTPYEYYEKYSLRKYGFHGTSHRFVTARLAEILGKDPSELKIVTCHLGNGSSITAVDGGKSVDTSMSFTPLDGLLMGTRSGSVDPSAVLFLMEKENLTLQEINDILNKKSGYLGVSGLTSDDRDLRAAAANGNERAELAGQMQRYQIKKYIGSYAAAMGGLDAVVFTGGIGEHSAPCRQTVCENMEFFGIKLDEKKNAENGGEEMLISTPDSPTQVWVIPTNEELLIARDTRDIVNAL